MEKENIPLKDVVAYVETRLEGVDISIDIAKELTALGATIEFSIKKNVTHVVFRDGTITTWLLAYDKGLHIVSVGWIKFCKDHKVRAPENLFRAEVPEKTVRCKFVPALSPQSSRRRSSVSKSKFLETSSSDLRSTLVASPSFPTIRRFVTPPSMRAFRERMEKRKSIPGKCPITCDLSVSDSDEDVFNNCEVSAQLTPQAWNDASNSKRMTLHVTDDLDKHRILNTPYVYGNTVGKVSKNRKLNRARSLKPFPERSNIITRSVSRKLLSQKTFV